MGWFSNLFRNTPSLQETLASLLHKQHDTIQHQSNVIAAITTPEPVPASQTNNSSPVNTQQAVDRPTPAPTLQPKVLDLAPWGYTVGPNGRVANTGPDRGWGWDGFGTPFTSQADADRYHNLTTTVQADQEAVYKGPIAVDSLTDDDKCFLLYCVRNYGMKNPVLLFYSVCSGPKKVIDRDVIEWADNHMGNFNITAYNQGKLGGLVDAFSKGMLNPIT